jgi:fatty-acyl-CoA synthase
LAAIEPLGFNVTQVYGLTETYGHVTETIWRDGWNDLPQDERAAIKARTGVAMPMMEDITVHDPAGQPVPRDGRHLGEIAIRGNSVMKGYYRNPDATAEAFRGGYFRSGDIAFQHPDGYIKITDRAKDIIISGGENVSSVEVEGALMHHPAVSLCAVVAKPDDKWGEVPCAFVELKPGASATEAELIEHCRSRLAGFARPSVDVADLFGPEPFHPFQRGVDLVHAAGIDQPALLDPFGVAGEQVGPARARGGPFRSAAPAPTGGRSRTAGGACSPVRPAFFRL